MEQLPVDATLEALTAPRAEHLWEETGGDGDVLERVEALARFMCREAIETLALGRKLIGLTVDPPTRPSDTPPTRGYRRVAWVKTALAPVQEELAVDDFERLVSALCMVLGWEALIILDDVRRADPDGWEETVVWAALAMVRAAFPSPASKRNREQSPGAGA